MPRLYSEEIANELDERIRSQYANQIQSDELLPYETQRTSNDIRSSIESVFNNTSFASQVSNAYENLPKNVIEYPIGGSDAIISQTRPEQLSWLQRFRDFLPDAISEPLFGTGQIYEAEDALGFIPQSTREQAGIEGSAYDLSLIHISEPTRPY